MRRGGTPTRAYKARSPSGTREAAKAAGQKFYIGEPCEHGHSGERYVSNMVCVECGQKRAMEQHDAGEDLHNKARRKNAFLAELYPEEFDRRGWRRGKVMEWQDNEDLAWG